MSDEKETRVGEGPHRPESEPVRTIVVLGATHPPGTLLDGKYRLGQMLGEGAVGVVYAADHLLLRKPVAVKVLRADVAAQPDAVARFQREARLTAQLEHEHIVRVSDFGRSPDGELYFVMDRLAGRTLAAVLAETPRLPRSRAINITLQVLRGLEVAHAREVVHRDLKPDNVFLEEVSGGGDHVKLLDFGIAKLRRDVELRVTRTGVVLGTPLYMSPEQTRGLRDVDARTDVHAVGVMLFEMIAGRPPYFGDNANLVVFQILSGRPPSLRTVAPEVPIELDAIVMRAFAPDRAKRFGSARELREALERYLWHRPRDLIAADAAVPPADAQPRTASPSHLEVHVEEPSWWAPSKAPPKAEYLSATPPPRLPRPRAEEHAATARSIPIDEASRHPSQPSVPAVPSSFVPPFAALSAAQRAARRKSGLLRLAVVAVALLVGAAAGVRVLLHHHAWLLRTQPSAPASK